MGRVMGKPLTRYVYIMRVRLPFWDLRWFGHLLAGKSLYKIGVANDAEDRAETVDRSTSAKVSLQDKYYCKTATRHESHLHKKFKAQKFIMLGMDGGTEVFLLSPSEYQEAKQYLNLKDLRRRGQSPILATLIFVLIILAILAYLKYMP